MRRIIRAGSVGRRIFVSFAVEQVGSSRIKHFIWIIPFIFLYTIYTNVSTIGNEILYISKFFILNNNMHAHVRMLPPMNKPICLYIQL